MLYNILNIIQQTLVKDDIKFSIPIYQRLFEWDSENVTTLLNDLAHSFVNSPEEDYYIGLLTETTDGRLVDGQQRFTVLTLLGIVLANKELQFSRWKDFISANEPRLKFDSRPKDSAYLNSVIQSGHWDAEGYYCNRKMKAALQTISEFIDKMPETYPAIGLQEFSEFLYHHICFFISHLPENYSPRMLNKYFERMNSAGKDLELHEILKLRLLKNLSGDISPYLQLWNLISNIDRPLLSIHKSAGETEAGLMERRKQMLHVSLDEALRSGIINGIDGSKTKHGPSQLLSMSEIKFSEAEPKEHRKDYGDSSSVVSFPILLLLTLYWMLQEEGKLTDVTSIKDFFNESKLLETFGKHLPFEGSGTDVSRILDFFSRLTRAKVVMDYCFIRSSDYGYTLAMEKNDGDKDPVLMMLESMLFVSSSKYTYYRWFKWLMTATGSASKIPSADELYDSLCQMDAKHNAVPEYSELSYGNDNRYWFWKLDFIIWKNRREIFKQWPDAMRVADNYRFTRNRSIEHVAPRHPQGNSTLQWNENEEDSELMNSFGNLVMISNSLNSSLSNQAYEVKKAHVQAYTQGSLNGSIESLSLLLLNQRYAQWERTSIEEYGTYTYSLLKDHSKGV